MHQSVILKKKNIRLKDFLNPFLRKSNPSLSYSFPKQSSNSSSYLDTKFKYELRISWYKWIAIMVHAETLL